MNETPKGKVLILRTCNHDMTSHGGFVWPKSGPVEAPDWTPEPRCGGGLHGFLWGEGSGSLANRDHNSRWLVAVVDAESVVDLGGKVKFPRAEVVYCGDRLGATGYILANGAAGKAVIGATVWAGDHGQATAGDHGRATAGDHGQATAGDDGRATAGDYGQATAGDYGRATAGYGGRAIAGDGGQAIAGDDGRATAGGYGRATAGYDGRATAGDDGIILIDWWDEVAARRRIAIAYVGEDGILPNVTYRWDGARFVAINQD